MLIVYPLTLRQAQAFFRDRWFRLESRYYLGPFGPATTFRGLWGRAVPG